MSGAQPAPDLTEFPPLVVVEKSTGSSTVREGKKSSWVAVAQTGSVLAEHVLTYGSEEGKSFVEVPDTVIQNTVPLWDDLVEGKFMDTAPHVAKIHAIVNRIWPLENQTIKIEVFEVDKTTVKFRIKDANTRARILRRGMWNIANIPMVVSKWSPEEEEEEEKEITMMPMWVTLKNVPRRMFSWAGLGFIASAAGKPKRLHPDTILCKSFEEAKVFVEADLTKELPKSHHFKSKLGVAADVQFEYPWLPPKCSICSGWGHTGQTCGGKGKKLRILKKKDVETEKTGVTEVENTAEQKEDDAVLAVIPEGDEDALNVAENANIGDEVMKEGSESRKEVEKETEVQEKMLDVGMISVTQKKVPDTDEDNWSDVSPSKKGRSNLKTHEEICCLE